MPTKSAANHGIYSGRLSSAVRARQSRPVSTVDDLGVVPGRDSGRPSCYQLAAVVVGLTARLDELRRGSGNWKRQCPAGRRERRAAAPVGDDLEEFVAASVVGWVGQAVAASMRARSGRQGRPHRAGAAAEPRRAGRQRVAARRARGDDHGRAVRETVLIEVTDQGDGSGRAPGADRSAAGQPDRRAPVGRF
jgi:hypothetical protein